MRSLFALASLVALAGCPDVRRPETKDFVATGSVYAGGVERRGEPLAGARVRAWPEGNLAGAAETASDDAGFWKVTLPAAADSRVLLEVALEGWVPASRALVAGPWTQVSFNTALEPQEDLDCSSGACTVASDGLRIDAPPEGAFGSARAFDPTTGAASVVGLETLRPLALAYVSLDGGAFDPDAGGFASDGGSSAPSVLVLRLPFDAWKRLDDAAPGTGRIEVPMRALDLATGQWTVQPNAVLVSEAGLELPESALPALRAGNFPAGAVAVAPLPASGFWAVAWPAASAGCIEGKAEVEGAVAAGVVLEATPREAQASGETGAFCAPAPVGASGDTGTVFLQYAGVSYAPASLPLPEQPGRCGAGSCRAVGTVKVLGSATLTANACKVTGTVRDPAGAPLPGAVVVGLDDSVSRGVFTTLCGKLATRCPLAVAADESAHFEVVMPVQRGVQLSARALVENPGTLDSVREGGVRLEGCPQGPIDLVLRAGRDQATVEAQLNGQTLTWSPAQAAAQVRATDADGGVKWDLVSAVGLFPPLDFGQVPAGAQQRAPAAGSPVPLASGDELEVLVIGTDGRGYQYSGGASVTVP